jgi:ABC-type polysaccharide/polyol phosphate transport system ATPase subunit
MTEQPYAVEFAEVSKSFSRHVSRSLLRNHISRRFQRRKDDRFYALKNINFRVPAGENLAVLGTNGAGKSTLLGLIAGLTAPDTGRVVVHGRVGALLELGSGFHPDLTGAENVLLNASLLGLSGARTRDLFDSIADFAGIGDFIGEPLRTYSTGMVMRLAFSVIINIDPDILLVDEVIAVGDQTFQQKCFDKVLEFKHDGRTLVCVSHNPAIVRELCTRAVWLEHGELVMEGDIQSVLGAYEGRMSRQVVVSS